jgi:hypothetical protein
MKQGQARVTAELKTTLATASQGELAPRVALLGWCERSALIQNGPPALWHTNILGLSANRVSHLFPLDISSHFLALAFYNIRVGESFTLEFQDSAGGKAFETTMTLSSAQSTEYAGTESKQIDRGQQIPGWKMLVAQTGHVLVSKPDQYRVFLTSTDGRQYIGDLGLLHAPLPPFTNEQVAAIRSDPLASKWLRVKYRCTECGGEFRTYAGIERSPRSESEGWLWSQDLGESFACSCGKMSFGLQYLKTGLHGLLLRKVSTSNEMAGDFVRLYEKTTLEEYCRELRQLIETNAIEEDMQNFLEAHPIFFNQFSPQQIMAKKPVLSKYVADFIVLNDRKELILIEIEKPGTPLIRKNGAIRAELQQPITQVRDWIRVFNDHRAAALDCIGLEINDVAKIRGVVIAGKTPEHEAEDRKLRSGFPGDLELYTYNDLLRNTVELLRQMACI